MYKRQGVQDAVLDFLNGQQIVKSLPLYQLSVAVRLTLQNLCVVGPVSYTHLDVYKRQAHRACDLRGRRSLPAAAANRNIRQGGTPRLCGGRECQRQGL